MTNAVAAGCPTPCAQLPPGRFVSRNTTMVKRPMPTARRTTAPHGSDALNNRASDRVVTETGRNRLTAVKRATMRR